MSPRVQIEGDRMRLLFDRYGVDEYALFLKAKRLPEYEIAFDGEKFTWAITAPARFAGMLGVELSGDRRGMRPLSAFLHDDQQAETLLALEAKRYAVWSDCGLGKTYVGAEWALQVHAMTGGRVLIITRNELVPQWLEMIREPWAYGQTYPILQLKSREQVKAFCCGELAGPIAITNVEKFEDEVVNECRLLAGVVLDESSMLAASGGKRKWAVVKSFRGVEYKLSLTATPAPNDYIEFASQAAFLERMRTDNDIIWTFFRRDEKTHRWTVKEHARKAFFEWMASWSIYVSDPRVYGWRQDYVPPPAPTIIRHNIAMTAEQAAFVVEHNTANLTLQNSKEHGGTASMFAEEANAITAGKLSQAAKGFLYVGKDRQVRRIASLKPAKVAAIVEAEVKAGLQVLVWTEFDAETELLMEEMAKSKRLRGMVTVMTGATPQGQRPEIVSAFRHGDVPVLMTRSSMLGFGQNFQRCGSHVFSGWSFSWQQWYQAIRRSVRDGQKKSVRVHVPTIPELEGQMLDAIGRKDHQHETAVREMEENYIRAMRALKGIAA